MPANDDPTTPAATPDPAAIRADAERALELAGKATKGPWRSWHDIGFDFTDGTTSPGWCVSFDPALLGHRDYRVVCRTVRMAQEGEPHDAAFIAASRSLVPLLCAHVKWLCDENDRLQQENTNLETNFAAWREWSGDESAELREMIAGLKRRVAELEATVMDAHKSWSFGSDQHHTHTWHDRADWIARHVEVIRELLSKEKP